MLVQLLRRIRPRLYMTNFSIQSHTYKWDQLCCGLMRTLPTKLYNKILRHRVMSPFVAVNIYYDQGLQLLLGLVEGEVYDDFLTNLSKINDVRIPYSSHGMRRKPISILLKPWEAPAFHSPQPLSHPTQPWDL